MLRFGANLTMLFNEVDFLARLGKAARAGFKVIEYLFPYEWERINSLTNLAKTALHRCFITFRSGIGAQENALGTAYYE